MTVPAYGSDTTFSYPVGLNPKGDNWLALRSKPSGSEGTRLQKLGPDTLFTVIGQQGLWSLVRLRDGATGWVHGHYVGCCRQAPASVAAASMSATQTTQIVVYANGAQLEASHPPRSVQDGVATPSQSAKIAAPIGDAEAASLSEDDLAALSERLDRAATSGGLYSTPIRPDDRDLGRTPRTASEQFPRVPFYIPGTRESGRFWVEPRVSDAGALYYDLTFVDPQASVDQRRAVIELNPEHLARMRAAVAKLSAWSAVAHSNEVRRSYRKRVDCFPDATCPREGEKLDGRTSTEVIFFVNEDGSTGGRIQRNKGRYDEGYNISVKSARLLEAYLHYVQSRAERDYVAVTRTKGDLDQLFR